MKLLSVVGWVMGLMLALPAGAELQIEVTQGADDAVNIDLTKPMTEILATLSQHPVKTRVNLTGPMVVARDIAHA